MVEVVAIPCVAGAVITILVAVGVYIPLLLLRWHREEREMVKKFGERYVAYQREVPAFFPRIGMQ
jgi:protein-S-isoprenylcysteine O-methyltransferase Ste14